MVIAAFVVSVAALLIAGLSAWYTRQQARSAREQAESAKATHKIEAERRHDERKPDFKGYVEPVNQGGWYRLRLRLETPHVLTGLTVQLIGSEAITFTHGQDGVSPSASASRREATRNEKFGQGELATWRVDLGDSQPPEMYLKVRCREEGEKVWSLLVPIEMPPMPPAIIA